MVRRLFLPRHLRHTPGEAGGRPALALLFLLVLLQLAGCALVSADGPAQALSITAPDAPVSHRGRVLFDACIENDGRYARVLFQHAIALVAQSAEAIVQADADGDVGYVTLDDATPLRPENTVAVLSLPPTPPFPNPPALAPTPTLAASYPYTSAQAQGTVGAQNQTATQDYDARLAAAEGQLRQAQVRARMWADALRALHPSLGNAPPSISQCVALASQRFNNWPSATKYLVIAATLPPPAGRVAWYSLAGVHVRWIDMGCTELAECAGGEDAWARAFSIAGVTDQLYYDPGESQALSSLFGAPRSAPRAMRSTP